MFLTGTCHKVKTLHDEVQSTSYQRHTRIFTHRTHTGDSTSKCVHIARNSATDPNVVTYRSHFVCKTAHGSYHSSHSRRPRPPRTSVRWRRNAKLTSSPHHAVRQTHRRPVAPRLALHNRRRFPAQWTDKSQAILSFFRQYPRSIFFEWIAGL